MELWIGCIAGALEEREFAEKLNAAGFTDVDIEPWRAYGVEDAGAHTSPTPASTWIRSRRRWPAGSSAASFVRVSPNRRRAAGRSVGIPNAPTEDRLLAPPNVG